MEQEADEKTVYETPEGFLQSVRVSMTRLLAHIRNVAWGTGWGEVVLTFKAGKLDEISSRQTEKVRD